MEFLGTKLRAALVQFQSISPTRRVAIGAVAVLLFLSLCLLIKSSSNSPAREYLYGGREFSRDELHAIESAFGEASLEDWKIIGYRVQVPSTRKAEYLAALSSRKLLFGLERPPEEERLLEFGSGRETRRQQEKEWTMSRVVSGMPGIAEVAVVYTESKSSGFPRKSEKRAVVAVKAVAGRHLGRQEVSAIRKAIVGSEAGLSADSVAVVDMNAKRTYDGSTDNATLSTPQSLSVAQERIYEDQLQRKILNRLVNYRGLVVEVNAQPLVSADTTTDSKPRRFIPQAIAVSIGVPRSYYQRLSKQRRNSTRPTASPIELAAIEAEILQKIEEIVSGLLNEVDLPNGRAPKIVVRTDEDLAAVDQVAGNSAQRFWALVDQRGRPLIIALAALALVLGWLILSRRKSRQVALPGAAGELPVKARKTTGENPSSPELGLEPSQQSSELQAQLSRLVQQDPDAAVDALRNWIKKVA